MARSSRLIPRHQRGSVLLEALIGFLIFAVGVLGLVGLQVSMTRAQTSTKVRADAAQLANEILGIMWADRASNHGLYTGASCASHSPCKEWQLKVSRTLPGGLAVVNFQPANLNEVQVTLTWSLPEEGLHKFEMVGVVAQ